MLMLITYLYHKIFITKLKSLNQLSLTALKNFPKGIPYEYSCPAA